jgi:hypothetical protein
VHDREKEVHDAMGYSEEQISELKKEIHRTRDEQLANITAMVRDTILSVLVKAGNTLLPTLILKTVFEINY